MLLLAVCGAMWGSPPAGWLWDGSSRLGHEKDTALGTAKWLEQELETRTNELKEEKKRNSHTIIELQLKTSRLEKVRGRTSRAPGGRRWMMGMRGVTGAGGAS
jgi:hypothetical protein